jgi:GT2 family glycosyltransferase
MTAPVAIVTPTHQRRSSLARVLDALATQSCGPKSFSVVVVCDGCTDGTAAMVRSRSYPFDLELIEQSPSQGAAAARNRALSIVRAPVVIFLDDDVIPSTGLIEAHTAHHEQQSDVVVIGPLIAPAGRQQPWIRWEAETLNRQYRSMQAGAWNPTPRQFYTGNASVRTQQVIDVGGFDPSLERGEDVDLAFKLQRHGLRFLFEPKAAGIHIARRTFRSWLDAAHEYGRTELAMGPVWGTKGLVDVKLIEFQRRHPMVRGIVRFALANPRAVPAIVGAARIVGRTSAAVGLWPVARGAYTAIFEAAYWRGVDQAASRRGAPGKSGRLSPRPQSHR